MPQTLVLGTRNWKKCQEIAEILGDLDYELRDLTAYADAPEVVEDGVSGWLVPPGDAQALASRLTEVFKSDARAMGQCGRRRVEADFTFAAQSIQYQQLFGTLVARHLAPQALDGFPRHPVLRAGPATDPYRSRRETTGGTSLFPL